MGIRSAPTRSSCVCSIADGSKVVAHEGKVETMAYRSSLLPDFRHPGRVSATVLLLVILGGCGNSGTEIQLVAGETEQNHDVLGYALAGEELAEGAPTITVQSGEQVTLTLENVHGQYSGVDDAHDLAILSNIETLPAAGDRSFMDNLMWEAFMAGRGTGLLPGETETITFVPDTPGTYIYLCTIPGHAAAGMLGEFVVEAATS